jgi:WD40 repeat protein
MVRWLSFFGAIALVTIGVVFFVYGGPPQAWFPGPNNVVDKPNPNDVKPLAAQQRDDAAAPIGPWTRVLAVTPRVVIPGARLTPEKTVMVPSMRDGQLLFLGTEIKLKAGEKEPEEALKRDAIRQEVNYLVIEVQPGEPEKDDWMTIGNRRYRPLTKRDDVAPNKVRLVRTEKWFRPIDERSEVKEGDLLGVVDPVTAADDLRIKVAKFDAAEADRAAEEKQRDEYRERWQRADKLYRNGSGSYEDMTAAKLAYEYHVFETVHKTEDLKVAASELRQAETMLDLHMIRSKIDGRVRTLGKHKGEAVKSLETVLEMQDFRKVRIHCRVDLQDLQVVQDPNSVFAVEATRAVAPQRVLSGHMGEVNGVAVSKDDQIVSVSEDRTARVWEKKGPRWGRERLKLDHPAAVRAVACTPAKAEKNLCLTGAADGVARLYNLSAEGDVFVRPLTGGHKDAINCVAFSPDGHWAVTGGDDRAICLWDVDEGKLLQTFPEESRHKGGVTSVAFLSVGPEHKLSVMSAGRDNAMIVWPLSGNGAPEKAIRLDRRGGDVQTLGVSPDGNQVLFDQGKELRVLSSENGALVGSLSSTSGSSFSKIALFSPDGKLILTSGGAGKLGLWEAPTEETRGHERRQLVWTSNRDEQATVNAGAFAPDGSFAVTGMQNRNVIVWPMPTAKEMSDRLTAKVFNIEPEVNSGQVKVTAEMVNPGYLFPGDVVTLVVYPEKQ